jgi:Fe-S-cluster-containing hydrogenase component 2
MRPNYKIKVYAHLCRDCQACALACSLYHEGECNLDLARLVINKDMSEYQFDILICQHCTAPNCILACPEDAMLLDERGIVIILDHKCVRCGACMSSCPHDAIFYSQARDRYLKCDLCAGREEGPLCVDLCSVGALALIGDRAGGEKT